MNPELVAAVERAVAARAGSALVALGAKIGLVLELGALMTLDHKRGSLALVDILAVLDAAAHSESGLAMCRGATNVCLAIRDADGIVVGVGRDAAPEVAWPALAPWHDALEDNHDRIAHWATRLVGDRVRFGTCAIISPEHLAREAALVNALIEQPHSRALRSVYADALLDRGDPRGELIHLELQDLSALAPEDSAACKARIRELRRLHHAELVPTVRRMKAPITFTAAQFRERPTPVHHARWKSTGTDLDRFVQGPRTRRLTLERASREPELDVAPLRDAKFQVLEGLCLDGVRITSAASAEVLRSLELPKLRILLLWESALSAEVVQGILANPACRQLHELELVSLKGAFDSSRMTSTFDALDTPELRSVRIEYCGFSALPCVERYLQRVAPVIVANSVADLV